MAASCARNSRPRLVFQADPGFSLQAGDAGRGCLRHRLGGDPPGAQRDRRRTARLALVVGVEKMTEVSGAQVGDILLGASYRKEEDAIEGGFAGIFGQIAQSYFQRYGDQSDALARIAAKNHKNGVANPLAQMQKDLGYEFCRTVSDKNPIVAGPLKRTDCSLVSDGAAAVVLADTATALSLKKAVMFRAAEQVNDFLPMSRRDVVAFEGPRSPGKRALAAARLGLDDLDLVETHDCFTIAELIEYEAMGLAPKGRGRARHSRRLDGKGRQIAGQSVRRPQIEGPSDRCDRRVDARAGGDAGDRPGRGHPGAWRFARRGLQHGWCGGRELRQHPRTAARLIMADVPRAACCTRKAARSSRESRRLDEARLPPGEVTVAVEYSTLNYKDGMILQGIGRLVRSYPHIPGIDFAGTVERSESPEFEPGDPVILTGWRVGEAQWGGYAQKARVRASHLVRRPAGLSTRASAMAIGTAGFTAMLAVIALERHGLAAGRGRRSGDRRGGRRRQRRGGAAVAAWISGSSRRPGARSSATI